METPTPSTERAGAAHSATETPRSAGDPIPSNCQPVEVRVAELKQLFNAMDPAPFRQRDLDPDAEDFIVGWVNSDRTRTGFKPHPLTPSRPASISAGTVPSSLVITVFGELLPNAVQTLRQKSSA